MESKSKRYEKIKFLGEGQVNELFKNEFQLFSF